MVFTYAKNICMHSYTAKQTHMHREPHIHIHSTYNQTYAHTYTTHTSHKPTTKAELNMHWIHTQEVHRGTYTHIPTHTHTHTHSTRSHTHRHTRTHTHTHTRTHTPTQTLL